MREINLNILVDGDLFVHLNKEDLKPLHNGVAIYARVALNEDDVLNKQIADLKGMASSVGDKNFAIYTEIASGLSKDTIRRKELYHLIADAEKGLIKRLYVKSGDRISRDFVFAREITEKLKYYGVELVERQ